MSSIVEYLYQHSINTPNKLIAADYKGNEITYSKAWSIICQISTNLKNICNINQSQRIMVECNQDTDFLLICLACELIGAISIPFEADSSADTFSTIHKETDSVLYIYKITNHTEATSISYSEIMAETEITYEFEMPGSDNISQILFTTGTTGKSKGIAISNEANVALAENIMYGTNMQSDNVEIIPLPISHSHGLRCCYANILAGGTVVLINGLLRIDIFFSLLTKYNVTAIDISPNAASLLLKLAKEKLNDYASHLRYIQIGTAKLSEVLKYELISSFPNAHLYNFYGSTESGRSCVLDFSIYPSKENCIGLPTVNSKIIFTDENHNIINSSKNSPGLLASSGKMNMVCYWNETSLTSKVLQNGYIYTNDLGYIDEDGFIYLLGRQNDVINYNGIKISPEEIESVAAKFDGVNDACCVPITTDSHNQIPKLFISITTDTFDLSAFRSFLNKHIDGNKMPKHIEIVSQIPRSSNGKLLRNKLK